MGFWSTLGEIVSAVAESAENTVVEKHNESLEQQNEWEKHYSWMSDSAIKRECTDLQNRYLTTNFKNFKELNEFNNQKMALLHECQKRDIHFEWKWKNQ